MREMPLHCTVRLWDTYWSEADGFAVFHLYVCASFLNTWAKELKTHKDFQVLFFDGLVWHEMAMYIISNTHTHH